MNRLTGFDEFGYYMPCDITLNCLKHRGECVDHLGAYEDTGLTPEEVRSLWGERNAMLSELNSIGNYDRLCELANADKDGRLVVLPCKVGDTVFLVADSGRRICECKVEFFTFSHMCGSMIAGGKATGTDYGVTTASFGKTVFLTRAEAEAALKEAKDHGK